MQAPFKQILVQLDDETIVPINQLPKESYEYFIRLTEKIKFLYAIASKNEDQSKPQQP